MALCIPEAIGVPGLIGQPPTWSGIDVLNGHTAWTAADSYSFPGGLDDPRWQGHLSIGFPSVEPSPVSCCGGSAATSPGFGGATNEDVVFRTLYDSVGGDRFLYLSWWIKADDANSIIDDAIHVGLERASGDAVMFRIRPSDTTADKEAQPVQEVIVHTVPAGGGAVDEWAENGGVNPSWIAANTHVWVDSVAQRWAVQMRIPIAAGSVDTHLDLADSFRMWFEVSIELPGDLVVPYSWPRNACVVDLCGIPSALNVPDPAVWSEFHFSSGPGDPACDADGFVRLTVADVGTQNSPTSKMNLISGNTFEAKPENLTGATINAGEIHADFRIADWGSVADPNAPWSPIPATGGTANPATNSSAIANGTKGSITMQWQLSAAEAAGFVPTGTKPKHQCILVTLSGAHVFNPASVWRNMDFVSASRFARMATISNVGLGLSPVPGTPRPAYILIEKLNMPPVHDQDERPDVGIKPSQVAVAARARRARAPEGNDVQAALVRALEQSGDPNDRLEQQPMIRYHVYHDTGLDIQRGARTLRVLRPGTAFGFYVDHEGDLDGWRDELSGATQVSERVYRLEVPEEGTAQITTVVEAVEPGGREGCADLIGLIRTIVERVRRIASAVVDRIRALTGGT